MSHWYAVKRLHTAGFTLLETLIIVAIMGILFALMVPGWTSFTTAQRLNGGQEQVLLVMQDAQSRAKQSRVIWQASFQNPDGVVQWAIHPAGTTPATSLWSSLDAAIQMDAETTLQQSGLVRRVQFDHEGHVNGQLGRLTLSGKIGGKLKRCVIVSTLLGVIRTGRERTAMQDGKYCY
ncbi:prepilin-type cleavage/methylation domain-containing protein [Stenomitos frigidus ULC18]|uniref:Prepilin-type cleavage/methylation domain-containing protein n=1 Tax=Stenomitos frigidus ULC18 TaxID=2107698 RepID=A0A2T1EAC2_9CYAN|nr:prepilin-type cleavage/methylation domain-containing protein [Stenomitos frigidus ULC18]